MEAFGDVVSGSKVVPRQTHISRLIVTLIIPHQLLKLRVRNRTGRCSNHDSLRFQVIILRALAEETAADTSCDPGIDGEVEGWLCEERHVEGAGGLATLSAQVDFVEAFVGTLDLDVLGVAVGGVGPGDVGVAAGGCDAADAGLLGYGVDYRRYGPSVGSASVANRARFNIAAEVVRAHLEQGRTASQVLNHVAHALADTYASVGL